MSNEEQKILIIEDDKDISSLLTEFLSQNGFAAHTAANGLEGLNRALSGQYSLILLDLMLPFQSGDEVLRKLRRESDIPVIVFSAKSLRRDKIELLNLGADDYITKPFDLYELLARVQANLKRSAKNASHQEIIEYDGITLDTEAKTAAANGNNLELTLKEYSLLALLLTNPKKVFSKQNLYESVWDEPYAYDNDTINTHISNLRKKLKDVRGRDVIETVWGIGYKIKPLENLENRL